ncbi:lipoprotein [Virgibacillus salexigens]
MWKYLIVFIVITIVLTGCNVSSNNGTYDDATKEKATEDVK